MLVVDDEALIETYIQAVLETYGYATQSFTDPAKALVFFRHAHEEIELIITDIKMPNIDGIQFAREAAIIKPGVPIIFVSADEDRLQEARTAVVSHACFTKPVERDEIVDCLQRLIGPSSPPPLLS